MNEKQIMQKKSTYSPPSIKNNIERISSAKAFDFLLIIFWTKNTILGFVVAFAQRLPVVGIFAPYILPMLFVTTTLLALPYICRNVKAEDILFALLYILIITSAALFYPKNWEYIEPKLWNILGISFPLYFVGLSYNHERTKISLLWASLAGVISVLLYQLYLLMSGQVLHSDNMDTAYNVLPSVLFLICWAFEHKKIVDWIIAGVGTILTFSFGTRGPILVIMIFIASNIFLKAMHNKSRMAKTVFLLVCAALLGFVFSADSVTTLAIWMSKQFKEIGFSTRIFDFIIDGEVMYDSGRRALQDAILNAIIERPILGYGFMGDRPIIGIYVHNIVLEVWCSYGVFFGTGFLIGIFGLAIGALWRNRRNTIFEMLLLLSCMMFIKLMLSGSYPFEPYFFLLIGICVRSLRDSKKARI